MKQAKIIKELLKSKKGMAILQTLPQAIIVLVVIGILVVVGLKIESGVRDQMTENSTEYNASTDAMEGLSTVSSYQDLLGLIVIMVVIIGLVIGGFAYFFRGRE